MKTEIFLDGTSIDPTDSQRIQIRHEVELQAWRTKCVSVTNKRNMTVGQIGIFDNEKETILIFHSKDVDFLTIGNVHIAEEDNGKQRVTLGDRGTIFIMPALPVKGGTLDDKYDTLIVSHVEDAA